MSKNMEGAKANETKKEAERERIEKIKEARAAGENIPEKQLAQKQRALGHAARRTGRFLRRTRLCLTALRRSPAHTSWSSLR